MVRRVAIEHVQSALEVGYSGRSKKDQWGVPTGQQKLDIVIEIYCWFLPRLRGFCMLGLVSP